jgi:hypothetical protein
MLETEAAKLTIHLNCLWDEYEAWARTQPWPTYIQFKNWYFTKEDGFDEIPF